MLARSYFILLCILPPLCRSRNPRFIINISSLCRVRWFNIVYVYLRYDYYEFLYKTIFKQCCGIVGSELELQFSLLYLQEPENMRSPLDNVEEITDQKLLEKMVRDLFA